LVASSGSATASEPALGPAKPDPWGDRVGQSNRPGVGWEFVHVGLDDASPIAFAQVLPDEKKESAIAFLKAAPATM
jgi:hypothetical protein